MGKLVELKEQLKALLVSARDVAAKAEAENRDFTAEERDQIQAKFEEAAPLKAKIKELEGDADLRSQIEALGMGLETGPQQKQSGGRGKGRSIGEQFVNSPQFVQWMKNWPNGVIPDSVKGIHSPAVEFPGFFGRKELIIGGDDTSAGAFVTTDNTGIYEPLGRMPLVLRDIISIRQTTSDLVEYVRQVTHANQAAMVPEANVTTYAGSTGEVSGLKPEATIEFVKVTAAVKTLAVWIPATKRALSDAAQIRGIIDQELRDDLNELLEDEIVNGDGTGEHFTGILNTPNILVQAWDTDILTTTRKAKTNLRINGRSTPTGWVLNPADWETIELLQDGSNRYYWGGPITNGEPRLWGVPVVESEAIAEGTALLGDFRKAVLWDREQASISVSDSHADFFIRNMIAILAESRSAFGCIRPSAFVEVDMDAGS